LKDIPVNSENMTEMRFFKGVIVTIILIMLACASPDPNETTSGENELNAHRLNRELQESDRTYEDVIYVPIYSDIYVDQANQTSLLAATLSIRNTSFNDSLFVETIDYYDTAGDLVRSYLEQPIVLSPMSTVNYVIEREDVSGGPGANFIVELSSDNANSKPILQAVMIGRSANRGFSFLTDGYSIR